MASIKSSYKSVGKKGISYSGKEEDLLGRGGYGSVHPGRFNGLEVAVKRIQLIDCVGEEREIKLQVDLNHINVVKILEVDQDDDFRYIVLELCAGTLKDFIKGKYTGPMPSDRQVLYQIACGVQYIHSMQLIHRDIKPGNILISYGSPVVMKVSDFGLSKRTSSQGTYSISGIKGTKNWMAPEMLNLNPKDLEKARGFVQSDIFATGCVFFYFIKRGIHPFGDKSKIENNILNDNSVNLEKLSNKHFAYGLIENLIKKKVEERIGLEKVIEKLSYKIIGEKGTISYSRKDVFGRGLYGSVHPGIFNGLKVAVKRIQLFDCPGDRKIELQMNLNHQNVLSILAVDKDDNFRYIVLELCAGTLEHFINKKYTGPMPPDIEVLYRIACGVQYLHSMKLVHRNIKPDNILISCSDPVIIKVSDYGLSRATSSRGACSISGIKGTQHWMAPEMLNLNPKDLEKALGSVQSDIFATGCVFFYFLKRGIHPFGKRDDESSIENNILNDNSVNFKELSREHFAYGLIENMMKKVDERISLTEVIETLEKHLYKFKAIERSFPQISGWCRSRFHPTEPVLACGSRDSSSVTILKGADGSIPFSNWKIQQEFKGQTQFEIMTLEWNVNGTQLAAGCADGTVIVWSYPSGDVHFEEKRHSYKVDSIAWNPFRKDVLATRDWSGNELLFWNSQRENGNAEKANHFLTLKRDQWIWGVAWISANQIAIRFSYGDFEIWEIELERSWLSFLKTKNRVVKLFKHGEGGLSWWIIDLQWNERTKYLASSSWGVSWIKIWSMDSDQPVHSLRVPSPCRRLAWRRNVKTDDDRGIDGERKDKENFILACGFDDGSVVIWNPLEEEETNRKRILPQKHSRWVESLSFSSDGRFLASADEKGELIIFSTETWLPLFTCQNDGWDLSWMSTDSSSVSAYKLAVSSWEKIFVVEQYSEE